MKCKICGHRTTTLPAMRKHYSQKHPSAMKRRKPKRVREAYSVHEDARSRIEDALIAFAERYNRRR